MNERRHERAGLLFAGLCAADAAFAASFAKLTTGAADALFVAMATTLFGAAFAIVHLGGRGELGRLVAREHVAGLALIGALGTGLAFLLYYGGASRASGIETALCIQIEPAYSLSLSWLALGHRPTRRRVIATLAILIGIAIAIGIERARASPGVWLLLATPFVWQLSHLVVLRGLPGVPPHVLTGARYVYGGGMLMLLWLLQDGPSRLGAVEGWSRLLALLAVQGVILSYAGTLLWYNAIARLDLARATSIVVPSIPVLSFAAGFAILGEVPSLREWIGLAITLAGVIAFVTGPGVADDDPKSAPERRRDASVVSETSG